MKHEKYNVPRGTIEKYIDLLLTWNKKINLVSIKNADELMDRHIIDSLQLMQYIREDEVVFDIGAGAGFPGLMLSYAGIKNINLVEKVNKKANFLIAASVFSERPPKVYDINVEEIIAEKCDVITARGFASLENILETTKNLNKKNTRYILLKGKNVEIEIKKALEKWSFEYILHNSITSDDGRILELKQVIKHEKAI